MTDYGRGAILGAATALPATSGVGLLLLNNTHPAIVLGLLIVSTGSLIVLLESITRFIINTLRSR